MSMDIERAIDILHDILVEGFTVGDRIFDMEQDESKAMQTAMSGLQELQQYRQIGTVDECMATRDELIELQEYRKLGTVKECLEAMEKQKPKAPTMTLKPCYDDGENEYLRCPSCGEMLTDRIPFDPKTFYFHCMNCGQALKWGD